MPRKKRRIELDTIIVCDDVRIEDNGKAILIGVYPRGIGVQKFPAKIQLSIFAFIVPTENGESEINIEIRKSWKSKTKKVGTKVNLKVDDSVKKGEAQGIIISKMPIELEEPGILSIMYRYEKQKWQKIRDMPVTTSPHLIQAASSDEPNASSPPS